jgi:hypothetical protein
MATLQEYREYPDGQQVAVAGDGPCCRECGSRDVLTRYREYPDGTLVFVDSLNVCCGCAAALGQRTLREYRHYPDGTEVLVGDTGACCDCDVVACCGHSAPSRWALSLAGVANSGGSLCCEYWNGDFVLDATFASSTVCTWQFNAALCPDFPGTMMGISMQVNCQIGTVTLNFMTGARQDAAYSASLTGFDWSGPNTFNLGSASTCTGWPATITVNPA